MTDVEMQMLAQIEDAANGRDAIAYEYGWLLFSGKQVDWERINVAIVNRWSWAGLRYIKQRAWKIVEANSGVSKT